MSISVSTLHATGSAGFFEKLNTRWHRRALQVLMAVVLAHWAEHIAQAWQVWVLRWPRHTAGGVLGLYFPWLVCSEVLHYGYALVMLVGMWILRNGFIGLSRKWWNIALIIQLWHHFEHALLLVQATTHRNLFHSPTPTSLVQLLVPRVELHLFYNTIVFIPMVIGMYYHLVPPQRDRLGIACTCAIGSRSDT
jgi:hypothetical protein